MRTGMRNGKKVNNGQLCKKASLWQQILKCKELLLLMVPGIIVVFIFNYIPLGGIIISFKDYKMLDGIIGSEWVGFRYFNELFSSTDFLHVLRNTFAFSITKLIAGTPAPIILALLINEVRNTYFKKCVQTISYIPHFFSWVVLGSIFKMLFSSSGVVNTILMTVGIKEPVQFFANEAVFFQLIIWTAVWAGIGWGSVIYLAALSGIDPSLYEAAQIDGASRWKQTLAITLPSLVPTIVVVTILNLGGILNAGFDQIYNMQNPMVYNISDILDTYTLRKMQATEFSYGTAVGLFKGVVGLVLVLGTNAISTKISDNGLW